MRDSQYDAPHAALIEPATFAQAQRPLRLVWRHIGTAANHRNARYRYYTCFSRNRHGRQGCRSDVLRADVLDVAVLESLLATYADTRLVGAAIERWRSRAAQRGSHTASEIRRVEAEISSAESAVRRYYNAFETGRLRKRVSSLELRRWRLG